MARDCVVDVNVSSAVFFCDDKREFVRLRSVVNASNRGNSVKRYIVYVSQNFIFVFTGVRPICIIVRFTVIRPTLRGGLDDDGSWKDLNVSAGLNYFVIVGNIDVTVQDCESKSVFCFYTAGKNIGNDGVGKNYQCVLDFFAVNDVKESFIIYTYNLISSVGVFACVIYPFFRVCEYGYGTLLNKDIAVLVVDGIVFVGNVFVFCVENLDFKCVRNRLCSIFAYRSVADNIGVLRNVFARNDLVFSGCIFRIMPVEKFVNSSVVNTDLVVGNDGDHSFCDLDSTERIRDIVVYINAFIIGVCEADIEFVRNLTFIYNFNGRYADQRNCMYIG